MYKFCTNFLSCTNATKSRNAPHLKLSDRLYENHTTLNPVKCHCTCLWKDAGSDLIRLCKENFKASQLEIVLGIEIDNKPNIEDHIKTLCSKASCNFIKNETLAQVFPCEFCEISNNTIFTEHLWTTAFVCGTPDEASDHSKSYSEPLRAKNEPAIHQHNIKILMKEI